MDSVENFKIFRTKSKLSKPISDSTHTLTDLSFIVLRLETSGGITSESYLLSFQYSPNAITGAKSFDWVDHLIDHPIRIKNGTAVPHDRPGWGFQFRDECLTEVF